MTKKTKTCKIKRLTNMNEFALYDGYQCNVTPKIISVSMGVFGQEIKFYLKIEKRKILFSPYFCNFTQNLFFRIYHFSWENRIDTLVSLYRSLCSKYLDVMLSM